MPNPLSAVGLVFHVKGEGNAFLGTCFGFRQKTHFLTAAHCIGNLPAAEIGIGLPHVTTKGAHPVREVFRHPKADLAVLVLAGDYVPPIDPFWNYVSNFSWGEDFMAFGFPEDVFGPDGTQPTARLFRGHYQRFMHHRSQVYGFEYNAGEMSIGAPAGLSGGPVFRPRAPVVVTGLVTENHQSTTFLQSVEEHQDGPMTSRSSVHEVIQYGVALLLDSQAEFLDEHVPPRAS
jgi:trypsin-like peptidase